MQSMLGDRRLDKRLVQLIEQLNERPQARLTQTLPNWASLKAGYRFVNNSKLNHARLIEVERQATQSRTTMYRACPITEKESYKWLAGLPHLAEFKEQIITVCDREADVYELFQAAHDHHLDFIVRVYRNRYLAEQPLLHEHLNQVARTAQVELRYTSVSLHSPKNRPATAQACFYSPYLCRSWKFVR